MPRSSASNTNGTLAQARKRRGGKRLKEAFQLGKRVAYSPPPRFHLLPIRTYVNTYTRAGVYTLTVESVYEKF